MVATVVGAVAGGVAGYMLFTNEGRSLRRRLEPAIEDFAKELDHFRGTVLRAADVATEGWKLLNDALGERDTSSRFMESSSIQSVLKDSTMDGSLSTTNVMLGIIAVVSVLEAILIVGAGVAGFVIYRRVMRLVEDVEARHITSAMTRVNTILDDLRAYQRKGEGRDGASRSRDPQHDGSGGRHSGPRALDVRAKTSRIVGFVRGARTAIETMLRSRAA